MRLHELQPLLKRRKIKRIGRGGKRGTYSGRGQKGQRARAGHRIRPAERDLFQRIPKLRGVKHKPLRSKPFIIQVGELEKIAAEAKPFTKKSFAESKHLKSLPKRVKILGGGKITKPFEIKGLEVSRQAKEKIEAAGGKILP